MKPNVLCPTPVRMVEIDSFALNILEYSHDVAGFKFLPLLPFWGVVQSNSRYPSILEHLVTLLDLFWVPAFLQLCQELLHSLQVHLGDVGPRLLILHNGKILGIIVSIGWFPYVWNVFIIVFLESVEFLSIMVYAAVSHKLAVQVVKCLLLF